jgi:hypothetical protein
MNKRGALNSFTIDLPEPFRDSSGNQATNITSVSGAAGAVSITATGVASNTTILKAGDFIHFSNHSKVYMVTSDAVSSGTNVTINIFPALRTGIAGATLIHKDVVMKVRTNSETFGFSSDPTLYSDMDLTFIEVIN